MVKAIARVVTLRVGHRWCFDKQYSIVACPSHPEFVGTRWTAPRDTLTPVDAFVVVKFTPDDQFAYEVPL